MSASRRAAACAGGPTNELGHVYLHPSGEYRALEEYDGVGCVCGARRMVKNGQGTVESVAVGPALERDFAPSFLRYVGDKLASAIESEREACARVVEEAPVPVASRKALAAAIRARGQA